MLIDLTYTIDPELEARGLLVPADQGGAPDDGLAAVRAGLLGWGTRVEAPRCSGPLVEGLPARTITDIRLADLHCDALVLDLRASSRLGEAISIDALEAALEATGRPIRPGDAVLLRTGQERFTKDDREFFEHPGMTREGTLFLTTRGAKVLGTDALSWDLPFPVMARACRETGDPRHLWNGHQGIVEKEALIVGLLANLGALPPSGFKVALFPLKVRDAAAAPCRAVAFLDSP